MDMAQQLTDDSLRQKKRKPKREEQITKSKKRPLAT